jgi:hypothetical protein
MVRLHPSQPRTDRHSTYDTVLCAVSAAGAGARTDSLKVQQ